MNEQIKNIRYSRPVFCYHLVVFAAFIFFGLFSCFITKTFPIYQMFSFVVFFFGMTIWEVISYKNCAKEWRTEWLDAAIHLTRIVVIAVCMFLIPLELGGAIFAVALFLFALEFLFFLPFDEMAKRAVWYSVFSLVLNAASVTLAVGRFFEKDISFQRCITEIITTVVVVFTTICGSEIFSLLWSYFLKQFFAQNRTVEKLNDANDVLQEHQARIKRVNEMLGMQKIELQTANKKINRSHDEMSVQNEISSTIAASVGKEDMLYRIVKIMQIRLDMDAVMIVLEPDDSLSVSDKRPHGRFMALASNQGAVFDSEIKDSVDKARINELLFLTKTYIRNSLADSVKFFDTLSKERQLPSLICVPIWKNDERLGTLLVGKNKENSFMDSRAFYENIASQLAIGISNARLYAKMNDMAIRDGLTHIYNRGHLSALLDDYIRKAMQRKVSVSLALFDIDKFKMINDTYGHQCGDEVIRHVASVLNQSALRNGGIAGRYGGEEFVVAFLDKELDETFEIVKKIHERIRSEVVQYEDKIVSVRTSVGIASYPETCINPAELLTRADWSMYHSKRNGRDQITIDSELVSDKM